MYSKSQADCVATATRLSKRRASNKFIDDQLRRVTGGREATSEESAQLHTRIREQFGGNSLAGSDWAAIFAANPEILVRFINSNSRHARVGQRHTNGPVLVARQEAAPASGGRYAGSLLIQSINAFNNDSVLLCAALGRFLRNVCTHGHTHLGGAPVLLTGVSWARKNKSIRNSPLEVHEVEEALQHNLKGRQAICSLVGLHPIVCNVAEAPTYEQERAVEESELWEHTIRLKVLVRTLWPELHGRPLTSQEIGRIETTPFHEWFRARRPHVHGPVEGIEPDSPSPAAALLSLFPQDDVVLSDVLAPYLTALRNIAVHQGIFSDDYFYYFWAQMLFQGPEFKDYLKIAPISERRFDDPMFGIRPSECSMDALYLPHYTLAKMRILPYSTEHVDLVGRSASDVANCIVMIRECEDEVAAGKLAALLQRTSRVDAIRLFVDALSFYVFGLRIRGVVIDAVECTVAELDDSLLLDVEDDLETVRTRALQWSGSVFSRGRDDALMPFFFRPFFWPARSAKKNRWRKRAGEDRQGGRLYRQVRGRMTLPVNRLRATY